MAKDILRRLKFDNETIARVTALITWHDDMPPLEEKAIRRAIHRIGLEQYPALFEVKRADTLAKNLYKRKEKLAYIAGYEKMYQEILEKQQCLSLRDLAVTGNDLIQLGMKPSKELGATLERLLMHVLNYPEDNTVETLTSLIKTERNFE